MKDDMAKAGEEVTKYQSFLTMWCGFEVHRESIPDGDCTSCFRTFASARQGNRIDGCWHRIDAGCWSHFITWLVGDIGAQIYVSKAVKSQIEPLFPIQ